MKKIPDLSYLNFKPQGKIYYQLSGAALIEKAICFGEGKLSDKGALVVNTGTFTGRSPKDRYIVKEEPYENTIHWGAVNIPISPVHFEQILKRMMEYLAKKPLYIHDAAAGADLTYQIAIRSITEKAYLSLFCNHLFIKNKTSLTEPEWTIIAAPGFKADPLTEGTRQQNFTIINLSRRIILVGGTGYAGELKKAIFSVLNFLLPVKHGILPMHCAANVGKKGDTALFFGLSGTGKTTLSADAERSLVGDDEHGWGTNGIFNFEGGCYAKCSDLSKAKEPQIYKAIRFGAILENTVMKSSRRVDFSDLSISENTRLAYPLEYVDSRRIEAISPAPQHIFFLTADAMGVLPPISRLSHEQAMFHFLSGYTAKVAGTEAGVKEPQLTFSACFGQAFLPLDPVVYADLLGKHLEKHPVNVWLINTGWTSGPYGTGERIALTYTRAMVKAALEGLLDDVAFTKSAILDLCIPETCPGVPAGLLDPKNSWEDKELYDEKAAALTLAFEENFKSYDGLMKKEIRVKAVVLE